VHITLLDRLAILEHGPEVVSACLRTVIDVDIDGLTRLEVVAVQDVFLPVLRSYAGSMESRHGGARLVDDGDHPVSRKRRSESQGCRQRGQCNNTTAYKLGHDMFCYESKG